MQPSMRYPSAQLPSLVHQHKSYQKHLNSLYKIMSSSSNQAMQRSRKLQDIKKSMARSFCFKEKEKQKQIGQNNLRLYSKIGFSLNTKNPQEQTMKKSISQSSKAKKEQGQSKNSSSSIKISNTSKPDSLLLRNHRQSPITKLTHYERDKVNEVLASHIINPYIPKASDYSLTHLKQQHRIAVYLRQKVRRFVDSPVQEGKSHLKSDRYVRSRVDKDEKSIKESQLKTNPVVFKKRNQQKSEIQSADQSQNLKYQQSQQDFQ